MKEKSGFRRRIEYGEYRFGPLATEGGRYRERPLQRMCANKERTATREITRIAPSDAIIDAGRGTMSKRNFFVLRKGNLVTRVFYVLKEVEGRAR